MAVQIHRPQKLFPHSPTSFLSLPKEIVHDLHRRTKAFNKSESETEKSDVKRDSRRRIRDEEELKEAINKSKFVLFCETLSRGLSRALHSDLADFVTYDKNRGRVFCVQDFVDSFLETDCYDFMFDLAQTAMFGEYMRTCVSLLGEVEKPETTTTTTTLSAEVDNEISRRSRKNKKNKKKKRKQRSRTRSRGGGERRKDSSYAVEEREKKKQAKKEKAAPDNYDHYYDGEDDDDEYDDDDEEEKNKRKLVFDRIEAMQQQQQKDDFVQDLQTALKTELDLDLDIEQERKQPNFIV